MHHETLSVLQRRFRNRSQFDFHPDVTAFHRHWCISIRNIEAHGRFERVSNPGRDPSVIQEERRSHDLRPARLQLTCPATLYCLARTEKNTANSFRSLSHAPPNTIQPHKGRKYNEKISHKAPNPRRNTKFFRNWTVPCTRSLHYHVIIAIICHYDSFQRKRIHWNESQWQTMAKITWYATAGYMGMGYYWIARVIKVPLLKGLIRWDLDEGPLQRVRPFVFYENNRFQRQHTPAPGWKNETRLHLCDAISDTNCSLEKEIVRISFNTFTIRGTKN